MRFYNTEHDYYCGIDLHARMLYVCIIDARGNKLVHKKISDNPDQLLALLTPYKGQIIVAAECMHCWYWVSDLCLAHGIEFIVGHALYMKAIHGGKAKNDKIDSYKIAKLVRGGNFPLAYRYPRAWRATRDLLRRRTRMVREGAQMKAHVGNTLSQYNRPAHGLNLRYLEAREQLRNVFDDPSVQLSINLDLNVVQFFNHELGKVERYLEKQAKRHFPHEYTLLNTIPGIGRILALTIMYEVGDIERFPSVQKFASYSRLVKCKAESAGKSKGTSGNKIGNAYLKWAFSEAAVLYMRGNDKAQRFVTRLERRLGKAKALSALAHKLGRCVYFMLKNKTAFDETRFLTQ